MNVGEVWNKRFESLQQRIHAFRESISTQQFDRQGTLTGLTECLGDFAERQFKYFYDGFRDGTLETSLEYPPDHVLTVTLEQISYDLEAIQWAAQQRQNGDANMQWALEIGDKLAWQALSPALEAFNLSGTTVIVYFQKFAEIRVIPYARVALIGLPITCVPVTKKNDAEEEYKQIVARDFLAIPHEVAHYVYWHGRVGQDNPQQLLYDYIHAEIAPKMAWGGEWLEELFADVYGCLIAGPTIAQSFQDLQMRVTHDRFFKDDGEHPAPLIRPDIYTKVLKKRLGESWATAIDELWQSKREKRIQGEGRDQKIRYAHLNEYKRPSQIISLVDNEDEHRLNANTDKPLDIAINELLRLMDGWEFTGWWPGSFGNEPTTGTKLNNDMLYTRFENHLMGQTNQVTAPSDTFNHMGLDGLYERWEGTARQALRDGKYQQLLRAGIDEAEAQQTADAAADHTPTHPFVWQAVLQAGGWATKGPENNPIGGPG